MGNPFSTPTCFEREIPTSIECAFLPGRYKIDRMPIRNSMPPPLPPDPLVFRSDDGSIGSGLCGIKGMQHCGEIGGRLGNLQRDWRGRNFTISAGKTS